LLSPTLCYNAHMDVPEKEQKVFEIPVEQLSVAVAAKRMRKSATLHRWDPRQFQFSLRTMLIVVTLLCVLLAYYTHQQRIRESTISTQYASSWNDAYGRDLRNGSLRAFHQKSDDEL
jgi:hypothetical protein